MDKQAKQANTIKAIKSDPRFIEFQRLFKQLTPSRRLYIKERELIIETEDKNSVRKTEWRWEEPDIIEFIFNYLSLWHKVLSANLIRHAMKIEVEKSIIKK